jgi:putative redox protein
MSTTVRPKSTIATFKLHSQGTGVAQSIQLKDSRHVIHVDAAPVFGGQDTNPSPIAYALSALISCSQVTAQLVAQDLGVKLNGFEFEIQADLDTDVLVNGAAEGNPNFQNVEIHAEIDTDITDELFETLKLETERRCPIYQLFYRSGVNIVNHWSRRIT